MWQSNLFQVGLLKTGSNMTRYDTTSGDDQARGPWEFDRDGTEPYPITWYMNGNAYDKIYWSTNGYMSFTSGHSSIESNVPGANDANGSIFGYYYDMYQGYSNGYSSNGSWSQHGGGNGSSHGAWGMGTANYQIQWSPSNSPTWVQAWAFAWCGTWYSGANRGKQASYTVIGVTDHQKQWIEVQYFLIRASQIIPPYGVMGAIKQVLRWVVLQFLQEPKLHLL